MVYITKLKDYNFSESSSSEKIIIDVEEFGSSSKKPQPNLQDSYVFAMLWQVTSCKENPSYPECHVEHQPLPLTLHGLWPSQKTASKYYVYCESEFGYTPYLSDATMTTLHTIMPSTKYNDKFLDHEWVKHGTCMGENSEDFFTDAIKVFNSINNTSFVDFVYSNNGEVVTVGDIYDAFDKSFGKSAHQHLHIVSHGFNGEQWLQELWIALKHPLEFESQQVVLDDRIYQPLDESMEIFLAD